MKIKTFKKITFLLEIHIAKIFLILTKNTWPVGKPCITNIPLKKITTNFKTRQIMKATNQQALWICNLSKEKAHRILKEWIKNL